MIILTQTSIILHSSNITVVFYSSTILHSIHYESFILLSPFFIIHYSITKWLSILHISLPSLPIHIQINHIINTIHFHFFTILIYNHLILNQINHCHTIDIIQPINNKTLLIPFHHSICLFTPNIIHHHGIGMEMDIWIDSIR